MEWGLELTGLGWDSSSIPVVGGLVLARVHSDLEELQAIDAAVVVVEGFGSGSRCRAYVWVELKFEKDRIVGGTCWDREQEGMEMPFQKTVFLTLPRIANTISTNINIPLRSEHTVRAANRSVTKAVGSTRSQSLL